MCVSTAFVFFIKPLLGQSGFGYDWAVLIGRWHHWTSYSRRFCFYSVWNAWLVNIVDGYENNRRLVPTRFINGKAYFLLCPRPDPGQLFCFPQMLAPSSRPQVSCHILHPSCVIDTPTAHPLISTTVFQPRFPSHSSPVQHFSYVESIPPPMLCLYNLVHS